MHHLCAVLWLVPCQAAWRRGKAPFPCARISRKQFAHRLAAAWTRASQCLVATDKSRKSHCCRPRCEPAASCRPVTDRPLCPCCGRLLHDASHATPNRSNGSNCRKPLGKGAGGVGRCRFGERPSRCVAVQKMGRGLETQAPCRPPSRAVPTAGQAKPKRAGPLASQGSGSFVSCLAPWHFLFAARGRARRRETRGGGVLRNGRWRAQARACEAKQSRAGQSRARQGKARACCAREAD